MSINYGFKVCRVCLTPEPAVKLKSMLEGRGEMADWFQLVSGCSISYDRGRHEALICPKCSNDVKTAFELHENIRRFDAFYFQSRREEAYEEEYKREQTAVEDTPAKTVSKGEINKAPRGSSRKSGAGAKRMPSQVRSDAINPKTSATAAKPNPGNPFKCHVCDKILTSKRNLLKHIEAIHEKITKFACDFCPQKCSYKTNLCEHIIRYHMSSKSCPKLKCDFEGCKKSCRTPKDLCKHKKLHAIEREFSCPACLKSFKFSQLLKDPRQLNRYTSQVIDAF